MVGYRRAGRPYMALTSTILTNQNYSTVTLQRLGCVALLVICNAAAPRFVSGQTIEAVGSRALGMGGAFVAVASDSTATWWNPAGLAAGPAMDLALAGASTKVTNGGEPWRQKAAWLSLGLPPLGISYYRFRITDIQPFGPIAGGSPDRQERGAEVPVRSLSASQLGVTLVQTLIPGVHAGTTLKYVRGGLRDAASSDRSAAVDGRLDLDIGVLAVADALRFGVLVRNVREPEFGKGARLPRQVRVGVAFDQATTNGVPVVVALDADLRRYDGLSRARRAVAVGAERWFRARRFGVRAGARFNTLGERERSLTAGGSWAIQPGIYLDGHAVGGGTADERGWGLAGRVSF